MADSTRKRSRRQEAREQRRSRPDEPVDEQEGAAGEESGSDRSEAVAAAKRAAAAAAAAALAGALAGAGKALLERRRADSTDTDEAGTREDDSDEAEDESDPSNAEPSGPQDGEEEEGEDAGAGPTARAEESDSDETLADSESASDDESSAPVGAETQPLPGGSDGSNEDSQPQTGAPSSDIAKIVELARNYVHELLGEEPESVTGIERSNGSWSVMVEVVELRRVPDTTDVLGAYEVVLDDDGNLVRFDRTRRYVRSQVEDVT